MMDSHDFDFGGSKHLEASKVSDLTGMKNDRKWMKAKSFLKTVWRFRLQTLVLANQVRKLC